jgi:hypothetical protein
MREGWVVQCLLQHCFLALVQHLTAGTCVPVEGMCAQLHQCRWHTCWHTSATWRILQCCCFCLLLLLLLRMPLLLLRLLLLPVMAPDHLLDDLLLRLHSHGQACVTMHS